MNTESPKNDKKSFNLDWKWWLAIIIAFATFIATIYMPYLQSRKKLDVFVILQTPLVKINREQKNNTTKKVLF